MTKKCNLSDDIKKPYKLQDKFCILSFFQFFPKYQHQTGAFTIQPDCVQYTSRTIRTFIISRGLSFLLPAKNTFHTSGTINRFLWITKQTPHIILQRLPGIIHNIRALFKLALYPFE